MPLIWRESLTVLSNCDSCRQLVAKRCREEGSPNVKVVTMDVLDFDEHKNTVDEILAEFKRIDILVRV